MATRQEPSQRRSLDFGTKLTSQAVHACYQDTDVAWRTGDSTICPHGSLGGMAPAEFTNRSHPGHQETGAKSSAA
jgi:hypothetical protein